jgi:hypothetical protein
LLFFGSFDAIVVVSSIFIMYPNEQAELRESALQHFRWTISRFETMQSRNGLAKSALGVLKTILSKFISVLGNVRGTVAPLAVQSAASTTEETLSSGSQDTALTTPTSLGDKALMDMIEGPSLRDTANAIAAEKKEDFPSLQHPGTVPTSAADNYGFPDESDMASLLWMPQLPTADLVYGDLNVMNGQGLTPESFGDGMTLDPAMMMDWRFGGGVAGDDTVWQYLNQFQPGQA